MTLLAIKNRSDVQKFSLYTSLKTYLKNQISSVSSVFITGSSVVVTGSSSTIMIPKVDFVKVRDVWLALHNAERVTKNLTPFIYNSVLE